MYAAVTWQIIMCMECEPLYVYIILFAYITIIRKFAGDISKVDDRKYCQCTLPNIKTSKMKYTAVLFCYRESLQNMPNKLYRIFSPRIIYQSFSNSNGFHHFFS
ncbi:hypothetical protein CHS0354_005403 [Potamilus streckersoni]|uniref:Uncharacterized protein n=1 Tax=Potamilus streckersoni TaxID=2493646 RepID=A0AAE0SJG3_9BIVA|nr:hypothetical protein CHS0354_005403 [Potamilus streckersoni]